MSVKPITPAEASKSRVTSIPDEVIEAFNELITEKLSGSTANILQRDVVERIISKICAAEPGRNPTDVRSTMYEKGWLDVEPIFEKTGWIVEYDKPCYYGGDNYEPYFEFKKRRTR